MFVLVNSLRSQLTSRSVQPYCEFLDSIVTEKGNRACIGHPYHRKVKDVTLRRYSNVKSPESEDKIQQGEQGTRKEKLWVCLCIKMALLQREVVDVQSASCLPLLCVSFPAMCTDPFLNCCCCGNQYDTCHFRSGVHSRQAVV